MSETQATRDAMADAETLLLESDTLRKAVTWNMLSAFDFMRNPDHRALEHVKTYSRWAASAAFRAIPQLRE